MPWIAVDSKLPSHRKLRVVRKRLGIGLHEAIGVLVTVWLWGLEDADAEGRISCANAVDMAEAIRWGGEPTLLLDALTDAGFIMHDSSGITIHDWAEHQGPWESYKQRKKAQREYMKNRRSKAGCRSDSAPDSRHDSVPKNDAIPIPNQTGHETGSYTISDRLHSAIFDWLGSVPSAVPEDLAYLVAEKGCGEELILAAIEETRSRGVRSWEYARAVVKSSIEEGILTGSEFKKRRKAREGSDGKRKGSEYVEGSYDWDQLARS